MADQTHRIDLIADSTADLPAAMLQQYDIRTVPLYILWGDEQLRDGIDISKSAFYQRMRREATLPRSSQPTPVDFRRAIDQCDAPKVLIITISSAFSGTYNAASAAAAASDKVVRVVDSRSCTMGLGWQVIAAARERERRGDMESMIAAATSVRERLCAYFTVDSLEYLHRGGRIGGAATLFGTALQLKPLLVLDPSTGIIEPVERTRTRKRAILRLGDISLERLDSGGAIHVTIVHAAAQEDAQTLADYLAKKWQPEELMIDMLDPIIGMHGGPGLLGVTGYAEPPG